MTPAKTEKLWLPYIVATAGILLSIFLAYLLWLDTHEHNHIINALENYFPWLAIVIGTGTSILIAEIVRVAQLARQHASTLDHMNADLKREIAERMSAEETKQKLEIALLQGQKLQAMGTLAGGIAHDFNNLLYAIIGYVEMARDDVDHDSLVYKNLGNVLEASHRGQELIARILAFSRRQQQHFDPIHLKTCIDAALGLLRPTIPASVTLNFVADFDPVILANQTQIHQILVNMINNAVDAMDGDGKIILHLSAANSGYCKIEITDTGHGMDQPTMERIFEPFYTTKEVGKGTGLGLSIVYTLVKEHQGDITVSSTLGHGSCFTILLPLHITEKGESNGKDITR